ncbi:MAG: hypothetical protein U5K70_00940 [Halodesulfurarchaeum sp.]|nr:hypothetical protein [Halodesulfurarchaeum sp.]
MSEWERQKREIDFYNVFHSALAGEPGGSGLIDYGYRLLGPFMPLQDNQNSVEVEPDISIFDGETLFLLELKSGSNISANHLEQMDDYSKVGLEAAEGFLDDTGVSDRKSVERIDFSIVYRKELIEKCRMGRLGNCLERLKSLRQKTAILTQEKGKRLKKEGGVELADSNLERILNNGISLPRVPERVFHLSENMEKESIAFSICHDIVINNLVGRFTLTPVQVSNFYGPHRSPPVDRIKTTMDYLNEIGACTYNQEEGEYLFTEHHEEEILNIESHLRSQRVEETLSGSDDGQAELVEFS